MFPTNQRSPRVHDLLLLRPDAVISAGIDKPAWIGSSPMNERWVVVRRPIAPHGLVAIGVRGMKREQRWGGFVALENVSEMLSPSQLSIYRLGFTRTAIPAFAALLFVAERLTHSELDWGPVGSVGYELATGEQVVTETSDLDLALFMPTRFTRDTARDLWSVMSAAPMKVDARIETPNGGFSLEEYACAGTQQVLVRSPSRYQLVTDPWRITSIEDGE